VILHDRQTGANTLISRTSGPTVAPGDGNSVNSAISADGGTIVFQTAATNLAGGSSAHHLIAFCTAGVYVRDMWAATSVRAASERPVEANR
jgi:hypothetical protein